MQIELTPDQEAFTRQAMEAGRLGTPEDAVREALALWEARERARAELSASLAEGEAALAGGKGRIITEESMRDLSGKISRRGRARLAASANTLGQ